MFKRISIFGLGLLGGSICKALKQIDDSILISAYGRNVNKLVKAKENGFVDHIDDLENVSLHDVDLIVVSTPVIVSIDIITQILENESLPKEAIIIDVGSVKNKIIESIKNHPRSDQFIGCHPMAGSEKMGFDASKEDLYKNSSVIITPHEKNRENDVVKISDFWITLGAQTLIATPDSHDKMVANTSHLPHILSCVIVDILMKFGERYNHDVPIKPFIGKGFQDVTRVSSGSPQMWHDITILNKQNITAIIETAIDNLKSFKNELSNDTADGDKILQYFSDIKHYRDGLL